MLPLQDLKGVKCIYLSILSQEATTKRSGVQFGAIDPQESVRYAQ